MDISPSENIDNPQRSPLLLSVSTHALVDLVVTAPRIILLTTFSRDYLDALAGILHHVHVRCEIELSSLHFPFIFIHPLSQSPSIIPEPN